MWRRVKSAGAQKHKLPRVGRKCVSQLLLGPQCGPVRRRHNCGGDKLRFRSLLFLLLLLLLLVSPETAIAASCCCSADVLLS